ncbi:serine/threonine protein kinase [bacterium]|nr:serine/threonine protein kinase [bacterium]
MLSPGDVVQNRYRVERMLGEGGMGSVYLAADTRLPRQWALKELILQDESERAQAEQSFLAEAQILSGLNHPSLPRVVDFFQEQGRHYLVMDYVQGETLEHRLEKGPLSVAETLKLGGQIAETLEYLHSQPQPVIFRDLKPANIILTGNGQPMLVDFGIARVFRHGAGSDTRALGTPGYAAPEQYGRGQSDHRTDLYALGATLHHCLSGRDPGESPFQFEQLDGELGRLLARAVSLKPEDRFQNAVDFRQALTGIERRSGVLPKSSKTSELDGGAVPPSVAAPLLVAAPGVIAEGFSPPTLSLGRLDWGGQARASLLLQGQVKGKLRSDSKWLKVTPPKVSGENVSLAVYADTRVLDEGGKVAGLVHLEGSPTVAPLRVELEVLPRKMPGWCWPAAVFLLLWSLVPVIGLATTPLMFMTAYSAPRRKRTALNFLAWTSAFFTLGWVTVSVIIVGVLHTDWKAFLHSLGI